MTNVLALLGLNQPRLLPKVGAVDSAPPQLPSEAAVTAARTPSVLPRVGMVTAEPQYLPPDAAMGATDTVPLLPHVGSAMPQVTNPLEQQIERQQALVGRDLTPQAPWSELSRGGKASRILGMIVPGAMARIPGTEINRQARLGQDMGALEKLSGLESQAQTQARGEEEVGLRRQQVADEDTLSQQEQERLNAPQWQHLATDQGMFRFDPKSGKLEPLTFNGQPLMGPTAQREQTPEQAAFDAYVKGGMTPEQAWEKVREKPAAGGGAGAGRGDTTRPGGADNPKWTYTQRAAAYKAYEPAMDSAERFNVMADNYTKGVKGNDQQAMLSLLANHLGMTMSLQKGARLNQAIIREAQQSRPWLQGIKAQFDKDGYLTGVTLSPQQMRQMVDLARERYGEDVRKATSEANYLGVQGAGPEREPGEATIGYYTALAGGDPAKAKALAQADGWTIQ